MVERQLQKQFRVLVLSQHFPNPGRPAYGGFVKEQVTYLQPFCDQVVVVPFRVFPHTRLWRLRRFKQEWAKWCKQLGQVPKQDKLGNIPIYYRRYTSLPRQLFHASWGFFAFFSVIRIMRKCHEERPFDLIHAHYASPCGVIALLAKRWLNIPIVLSIHGADVYYTARQNRLGEAVIRWVFRQVDAITANSHWTKEQIVDLGGDPKKVTILRLGVAKPEKVPVPVRANNREIVLLSVGYLRPLKGHTYVLQAIRELMDLGYSLKYVIVGDGSEEYNLHNLADQLKLTPYISFEGYKPHNEVWSYFAVCDIFVLPSWVEGFGMVYTEALSLGKPVIGCEGTGGPEDLKQLGDCIELVKPHDVNSLVSALKRLIDNPERRQQMGQIGRDIVNTYYTWDRNAQDTLAIYNQVLEK